MWISPPQPDSHVWPIRYSHIIVCSFSLSFAYATQTHTHAHVPGNPSRGEHSTSGGQGFVSCYISWVALYWTLALPDGSPSDQDEWCLISPSAPTMPFHSIYVTNLSFSVAICYFTRAAVHFTYACVSAYGHTSDFHHHTTPPPPHRGGMLSPTVICVIRVYISSVFKSRIKRWIKRWKLNDKVKIVLSAMMSKKKYTARKRDVHFFHFCVHKVTLGLDSPMVLYHVRKTNMLNKVSLGGGAADCDIL